ncbi:MAG: ribonuclease HII [Gaiellaceae bacterium]
MGASCGRKLIEHDRSFGARFVAGADEAGRGSLAGPLSAAAVVLDLEKLRGSGGRALAGLRDSKQCDPAARERLLSSVLALSELVVVELIPAREIDRGGLHKANLEALRRALTACVPPAELCLVDGFSLGPEAPPHEALVGGDERSAAIACASIVAKVVRDRMMRRLDALYPNYGFSAHVGYITGAHSAAVRRHGPSAVHRRSFNAACYGQRV